MINILIIIFIGCGLGLLFTNWVDRIEDKYMKNYMEEIISEINE